MEIQQNRMKCNCGKTLSVMHRNSNGESLECPDCGHRCATVHQRRFNSGVIVVTRAAEAKLSPVDVIRSLSRHLSGDWGELCDEDWQENEIALVEGNRLFSSYVVAENVKLWIITECDRSVTTLLLPSDY